MKLKKISVCMKIKKTHQNSSFNLNTVWSLIMLYAYKLIFGFSNDCKPKVSGRLWSLVQGLSQTYSHKELMACGE